MLRDRERETQIPGTAVCAVAEAVLIGKIALGKCSCSPKIALDVLTVAGMCTCTSETYVGRIQGGPWRVWLALAARLR